MLPWFAQAQDDGMPKDTSQVRAGSEEDQGPNWWFYGVTGVAFMSVYYVLRKIVMNTEGDSGL